MSVAELIEKEAYTIAWNECHHEGSGEQHRCGDCREEALTRIAEAAAREAIMLAMHPFAMPDKEIASIVNAVLGRDPKSAYRR